MSIESIRHASFVIGDELMDQSITNIMDDIATERKTDVHDVYIALEEIRHNINVSMDASVQLDEELSTMVDILEASEGLMLGIDDVVRDLEWHDPDSPTAQSLRRITHTYNLTVGLEEVARV